MMRWIGGAALAVVVGSSMARAESSDLLLQRLDELEQEVRVLKRQLEVKSEADATRAKDTPAVGSGKDGFYIQAPDRKFQLRLRGHAQFDSRLAGRPDSVTSDTFGLRRVRLNFEGTVGEKIDFRIMPDFAGGTFTLFDAYANLKHRPGAMVQVGKFKPPVGLERLQSATAITFIERGFPTLFVPSRDIGVQLHGELLEGKLQYQTASSTACATPATSRTRTATPTTARTSPRASSRSRSPTARSMRCTVSGSACP